MSQGRDKVAIVTGASFGIGREVAMVLGERGFRVCSISLGKDEIEETRRKAKARGIELEIHEGDVSKAADVEAFQRKVAGGGPVRALVNNAAIRPTGTVLTTSEEDWDRVYAVNMKGTFLVTKAFLPSMIQAGGGAIINISSCSAMGSANLVAYSGTKAALLSFTRCVAEDHKKDRIRVNSILPGPIDSGMMRGIPPEMVQWCADNGVQPRLGLPKDVAAAVAFLVSDEAETISGTELRVNFWPALFA